MTANITNSSATLHTPILFKKLKLNKKNLPKNEKKFSQALDTIRTNWDNTDFFAPKEAKDLKDFLEVLNAKYAVPGALKEKLSSIYAQVHGENTAISTKTKTAHKKSTKESVASVVAESSKPEPSITSSDFAKTSTGRIKPISNATENTASSSQMTISSQANAQLLPLTKNNFNQAWETCFSFPSLAPKYLPLCIEFIQENTDFESTDEAIGAVIKKIQLHFLSNLLGFRKSNLRLVELSKQVISTIFEQLDVILKEYSPSVKLAPFREMITKIEYEACSEIDLSYFPNTTYLKLSRCKFTEINAHNVKEIEAYNSVFTKLVAPHAEKTTLYDCQISQLDTLAKEIILNRSSLQIINAPLAERIISTFCEISELKAPQIKEIVIRNTKFLLPTLKTPAEKIFCTDCENLNKIIAPNATVIQAVSCSSLATIYASPITIISYSFSGTKKIHIEQAKELKVQFDHDNTKDLTTLVTVKVEKVICQFSKYLGRITSDAQEIEVEDCEFLTQIDAMSTKKVTSLDCINLNPLRIHAPAQAEIKTSFINKKPKAPKVTAATAPAAPSHYKPVSFPTTLAAPSTPTPVAPKATPANKKVELEIPHDAFVDHQD